MRKLLTIAALALACQAGAERYIIKTKFHTYQPAQFRVLLNGQTVLLHRNADGDADITHWVKEGKNKLEVEVTPGKNLNQFSSSVLTLGAGDNNKWRTLYKKEVGKTTPAGKSTFVFMAKPSTGVKASKVSLFGEFHTYQPVEFEVPLNGETISSMNEKGNYYVTPFLKPGKNVLTVKYTPGKNANQFSHSVLTVGQQMNGQWASLLKLGIGKPDAKPGSVAFPIYY